MIKKEITAGKNDSGQRLDRFLIKAFSLTIGVIMKAVRNKDIKINNKPAKAFYILKEGDVIKIFLKEFDNSDNKLTAETLLKIPDGFKIVYEDENILLADKPCGLASQDLGYSPPLREVSVARNRTPGGQGGTQDLGYRIQDSSRIQDTLINRIKAYLYKKGEFDLSENSFKPALCNRIDRNTSGIVIAAKTAEALRILNEKLKLREVKKQYLCILTGVPKIKEAVLTAYLEKDEKSNIVKISNKKTPQNKTIITKYKIIGERNGFSLAEIDLLTGRTHQIRAHMAYIGYPLLGDGKYGRINKKYNFPYQALCSYKLKFDFKDTPCDVPKILDYLNGKSFKVSDIWFLDKFYEL